MYQRKAAITILSPFFQNICAQPSWLIMHVDSKLGAVLIIVNMIWHLSLLGCSLTKKALPGESSEILQLMEMTSDSVQSLYNLTEGKKRTAWEICAIWGLSIYGSYKFSNVYKNTLAHAKWKKSQTGAVAFHPALCHHFPHRSFCGSVLH